jgi:predicted nucleotidyltransferase
MDPLLTILKRLLDQKVEFVVIGGMAAMYHGSSVVTQDIDFCVPFDADTMARILEALRDIRPTFRQRPDRLPLWKDPARLAGLNLILVDTDEGPVDFLKDVAGVGTYPEVAAASTEIQPELGLAFRILNLDALIAAKRAAGRRKDMIALPDLEALRKRVADQGNPPERSG